MNSLTQSKSWKASQTSALTNKSFMSRLAFYPEFSVKCKRRQNTETLSGLTCSVLILLVRLCKCFAVNGQIIPTAEVHSDIFFFFERLWVDKVEQGCAGFARKSCECVSEMDLKKKEKKSVNLNQKQSNYIMVGSRTDSHPAEIVVVQC